MQAFARRLGRSHLVFEAVDETKLALTDKATIQPVFAPPKACDHTARLSFYFLWLFTVAIYARPEDIFPFLGSLHLPFVLGVCSGLTYVRPLLFCTAPLPSRMQLSFALRPPPPL